MSGDLASIISDITDAFGAITASAAVDFPVTAVQTTPLPAATDGLAEATLTSTDSIALTDAGSPTTGAPTDTSTGVASDSPSSPSLPAIPLSSPTVVATTDTDTQTSTPADSSSFTPTATSNVNLTAGSTLPPSPNHNLIIGIAAGVSLLVALVLIYFITRVVRTRRRRRQHQLDHALDASFNRTMSSAPRAVAFPAMDVESGDARSRSMTISSEKSAGSLSQPPLEHYYTYDRPQLNDYASHEYPTAVAPPMAAPRAPEPAFMEPVQIVQAQRGHHYPVPSHAHSVHSHSATIHGRSPSPGQAQAYLTRYPTTATTTAHSALSPTADIHPLSPLPNPYGEPEVEVEGRFAGYRPTLGLVPPPPPLPRDASRLVAEHGRGHLSPVSPALPNPYGE
ncbi:hypothetical protein C8R46DRAFT_1196766 [Mycena filopes]|nr:hypothetical protein C8R46DRAFT_1196766 [Mycena filopes]